LLPRGGYQSRYKVYHYAATNAFRLDPGKHTVTFERVKPRGSCCFIDTVHLSSEDAFYGGPDAPNFPSGGNAIGQNAATGYYLTAQAECEMAQMYGLVPCTYEGGWAVQADFDHYSMLAWSDLRYGSEFTNPELTKRALRNAFNIWCEFGGYIYAYFYAVQKKVGDLDAPLLKCIQEMNDELSGPPKAGTILPGTVTPEQPHSQGGVSGFVCSYRKNDLNADVPARHWKGWIVTSNETRDYRLTLTATGGKCELAVNDIIVAEGNAEDSPTATVRLVAGVHSVKVKAIDSKLTVIKMDIE
jgi:hypothetical protein